MSAINNHPYRAWLEKHLEDATTEYKRIQKLEEEDDNDQDLYERTHQMWGYLAALEKCLKELSASEKRPTGLM